MEPVDFKKAYYIHLGKGGQWEIPSINESKLIFGWSRQALEDINNHDWEKIKKQLLEAAKKKGEATKAFNALRCICESTPDDLWITFSGGTMWWCKLQSGVVYQDKDRGFKYRPVDGQWRNADVHDRRLEITYLPGILSKTEAFRATVCKVKGPELETLKRIINDLPSAEHVELANARSRLTNGVDRAVKLLHWKDFETLVDLVFRASGWRRLSMLGQKMKYMDLELAEPLTGDRYQVQVKSESNWDEFKDYADKFDGQRFRRLYYVVHTCGDKRLAEYCDPSGKVELLLSTRLSEKIVDLGLVGWLMEKVR